MVFRRFARAVCVWLLGMAVLVGPLHGQERGERPSRLPLNLFRDGNLTVQAFKMVSDVVRGSVVQLEVAGELAALGTVVGADGWVATKASEVSGKEGKLICRLADGTEAEAELVAVDDENDVGLVKVNATDLRPVEWRTGDVSIGQWAVTPGIQQAPEAVGIISVAARRILHKRALIGVELDFRAPGVRIADLIPGMGAERAGLKPGDEILGVNDSPIQEREELVKTLRNFRHGQTVRLLVRRGEEEFELKVEMSLPPPERFSGGFDRSERMNRLGTELSERAEGFESALQHDTVLQPWQCGGPLVDLEGRAIGLNIARAGRIASYALSAELVKRIVEDLRARAEAQEAGERALQN